MEQRHFAADNQADLPSSQDRHHHPPGFKATGSGAGTGATVTIRADAREAKIKEINAVLKQRSLTKDEKGSLVKQLKGFKKPQKADGIRRSRHNRGGKERWQQ